MIPQPDTGGGRLHNTAATAMVDLLRRCGTTALDETTKTLGFRFDNSYRHLDPALFAEVDPVPVSAPRLLLFNADLAGALGLEAPDPETAAQIFSGNQLLPGSEPIAQAYAGHQFGHATMLGDGRAVLLGEHLTPDGQRFDIQLKGSGRTPFSRGGDGRAALGPMLREYLISEAMAALCIPTTRALAVVATGETVIRGHLLPGAILTRVARSHLRVGTFQYAAWHRGELLPALFDYTVRRHYPEVTGAENPPLALLGAVMSAQIDLVVDWLRVGFIHGVMNTDNMALAGETIDFGPCAFMDEYHRDTVFSSIDHRGRYAYANQGPIALWNLERFAECLLPLIDADADRAVRRATAVLDDFGPRLRERWLMMMRSKLGLVGESPGDEALVQDWLGLLEAHRLDWTNSHRSLLEKGLPGAPDWTQEDLGAWHERWRARQADTEAGRRGMVAANPVIIPRNHRVEQALAAAETGDLAPFLALHEALAHPGIKRASDDPLRQPPSPAERVAKTFCGT